METVVFICPHGAAKSVIAATYFRQLAEQHNLPWRAVCGGTKPDEAIVPSVLEWLKAEGFPTPTRLTHRVTAANLSNATRVVAMNCESNDPTFAKVTVENWDDVPPVSHDLPTARAIIRAHVEKLIHF